MPKADVATSRYLSHCTIQEHDGTVVGVKEHEEPEDVRAWTPGGDQETTLDADDKRGEDAVEADGPPLGTHPGPGGVPATPGPRWTQRYLGTDSPDTS